MRTERWRYLEWGKNRGDEGIELYDPHTDAFEMNNLASAPDHLPSITRLAHLFHRHGNQ